MPKTRMRDVVVMLPGIMGSVLQKDGRDVWAFSGQAAWKALRSLGQSVAALALDGDDPDAVDLGDGVVATRVIDDLVLVPGLKKVNGYSAVRTWVQDNFDVVLGAVDDPPERPANFYELPYDWRRHAAASAGALAGLVETRLPRWREHSGAHDAKVILLVHSLGGLVARHYVDVLGGWKDCRALVTFGTPHRGSVNALDFLANGYKKAFVDLSGFVRSCSSIYELLPIYPMLEIDGQSQRVADAAAVPGVDRARAVAARAFHQAIEDAVTANRKDMAYRDDFTVLPVVGTRQEKTLQSARLVAGKVVASAELPAGVPEEWRGGDGTVPMVGATPIEFDRGFYDTFVPERHSSIHLPRILDPHFRARLQVMQAPGIGHIRGELSTDAAAAPAISLDLDDLYLPDEPVTIGARLVNVATEPGGVRATIREAGASGPGVPVDLHPDRDGWSVETALLAGVYEIEVRVVRSDVFPDPVHDVFEVAG